jgi:hypothetical protein
MTSHLALTLDPSDPGQARSLEMSSP